MKKWITILLLSLVVTLSGCVNEETNKEELQNHEDVLSLDNAKLEKFVVRSGDITFYTLSDTSKNQHIKFQIESDKPITIFVVPSKNEFDALQNGKEFYYFPELSRQDILSFTGDGVIPPTSYIVIINNGEEDAQVSFKFVSIDTDENALNPIKSSPLQFNEKTQKNVEVANLEVLTTYYEPYPLAFYNVFYELGEPDITFEITNNGDEPITVRLTSEYQGYSNKAITTETIMPGETKEINQTIPLIKDKIKQIKTKTKFSLHYKIEYDDNGEWKTYDEQTVMIDVYPMDTMVWAIKDDEGNEIPMYEYVAVFVTPKDNAIMELLGIAKEYHPERTLAGYQYQGNDLEGWREYTNLQIKAIYDALKYEYGMSYVNTPIAYGKDAVQKVKLPRETLATGSGNCIDGAVLFASAIEALGMHPYIVIVPGHAFVAWDIDGTGRYIEALETTMVGSADFEDALNYGNMELEEYWDALTDDDPWNGQIIDIKECRELGILPME